MPRDRDPKRQGEVAELAFAHKAAALGFTVSKPYGENSRYDFIVDSGGCLTRVQVKSVAVQHGNAYRICSGSGNRSKCAYTSRQIDLLAACVLPHNAWYLIPIGAFAPVKTLKLCPHRSSRGRFERFREAWHLLRPPATAASRQPRRNQQTHAHPTSTGCSRQSQVQPTSTGP